MILKKYKTVISGILLGGLYWLIESIIHTFIFIDEHTFIENLFFPSAHEIWMRVIVLFLLITLSIYSQFLFNKINDAKKKIKESEEKYREAYNHAEFYKDIATHDMGNILNNIKTSVKLITMFQNKPDYSQKLNEMLNIIKSSVDRGVLLISNIRTLSKIEESEISLQSTEFNKFLDESIKFLHKSFQDKEIIVHVDNSKNKVLVKANNLLLDVFENILINAAKYNENPNVFISIKIFEEKQQDVNYVRFEFEDNGVGIPDTQKELIFQKGFKKDKNVKGMGIGLNLVKKIIDSYKGKIWVEDKVKGDFSKGSNFILIIPEF